MTKKTDPAIWDKMKALIKKLKKTDPTLVFGYHDRFGMRAMIINNNPLWKPVFQESLDDVIIILDSMVSSKMISEEEKINIIAMLK